MLGHLLKLATAAHHGTSFSPEKRGEAIVRDYGAELKQDVEALTKQGTDPEIIQQFQSRYENMLSNWLSAKSRCLSPMITGPARFPTNRNRKANDSEQNKYELFRNWRLKALNAITRKNNRQAYSNQSELEKYKTKLANCIKSQELMKAVNAIVRKKVDHAVKIEAIKLTVKNMGLNVGENFAEEILKPDHMGRIGFASYALTNNNAEIHRLEGRIKEIERKAKAEAEAKEAEANDPDFQANQYPIKGGYIVVNFAANRIQVFFDEKPGEDMRNQLKRKVFKWAPSQGAWQRQITANAIFDTNRLFGVKIPRI